MEQIGTVVVEVETSRHETLMVDAQHEMRKRNKNRARDATKGEKEREGKLDERKLKGRAVTHTSG